LNKPHTLSVLSLFLPINSCLGCLLLSIGCHPSLKQQNLSKTWVWLVESSPEFIYLQYFPSFDRMQCTLTPFSQSFWMWWHKHSRPLIWDCMRQRS
jgi:hypothetical protein